MSANIIVITARMDSARLPGKALVDLGGQPNLVRLVERFGRCKRCDRLVVATSDEAGDDAIADTLIPRGVQVFRGSKSDVLGRVIAAVRCLKDLDRQPPSAVRILRATADCPFISWEAVDLAFDLFKYYPNAETARLWGLGEQVPVYGAGEFPVSLECLEKMDKAVSPYPKDPAELTEWTERVRLMREHVTSDIDANRLAYRVVYPNPPRRFAETFYRPYRLELDTPHDLALVNRVIGELGANPPLHQVVRFLDANPEIVQINAGVSEKTGPAMYSMEQRARWKSQQATNTVEWRGDWSWLNSAPNIPKGAKPIYCKKGIDYVGYVSQDKGRHSLTTPAGDVLIGRATLACECGAGREWHEG